MQHIADSLGISKNAVSLALNGKNGISETLREKVLVTASQMGYFQNTQKKVKSNNLLLIIDDGRDNDRDFFFPVLSDTVRYAKERGYNVLMTGVNAEIQERLIIPKVYYDIEAEGVVFTGNLKREFVQKFLDAGIPSVLMVQHLYGLLTDNVVSDNEDGGYLLTKHLIESGHRKIGYIADTSTFDSFSRRLFGYRKALFEANIPFGEYEYVFNANGEQPYEKTIDPHMDNITGYTDKPTAWLCGNDHTAIVLINEFRKRGIQVPEDVSVAGFDAISTAFIFHPTLCTYDSRIDLITRHSVDLLISHIENGNENWNPVMISVMGKLIPGESVRRLDMC